MKLYSHAWFVIWQLMTNFFCFPLMSLNQGYCFSCTNSGNNLRHPKGVRYAGGHVMRTFRPFGGLKMPPGYCDDDVRMMIYFLARECYKILLPHLLLIRCVVQWEAKESKFRKTLEVMAYLVCYSYTVMLVTWLIAPLFLCICVCSSGL
jgi:hypothetical protein